MKKINKVLGFILPIFIIAMFMFVSVTPSITARQVEGTQVGGGDSGSTSQSSLSTSVDWKFPETGNVDKNVQEISDKVWGTILTIAQILAFAAIIFVGVRYMFASAEQKADIKRGLIYLLAGSILVFATSTVVKIIVNSLPKV